MSGSQKVKTVFSHWFVYAALFQLIGLASADFRAANLTDSLFANFTTPYLAFLDDLFNYLRFSTEDISLECRSETQKLANLALSGDTNALKILDASGKASSGILEGGVYLMGFYSECVDTTIPTKEYSLHAKYCLINFNVSASSNQQQLPQASWLVLSKSKAPPTIGICVPKSCSVKDVQLATNASLYYNIEGIDGHVAVCHVNPDGMFKDAGAVAVIIIFSLIIMIAVSATVLDYLNEQRINRESIKDNLDENDKNISTIELCQKENDKMKGPSIPMQCLLAFSLKTNARKIFTVGKGDNISALHGLKFLTMVLIIFGHTFSFGSRNLFFMNPGLINQAPKDFLSQFLANGTLTVDTFYLISGLLVAFVVLKMLDKLNGKFPLLYFYFHRYFRLTPLMGAVVFFCAYVLQYLSSGPNWLQSIEMYDSWCRKNGWLNILYLHNFFDMSSMCLSHTWYLATDMQMYIVSPLILIPLHRNKKWGFISIGSFLLATILTTAIITAVYHYPAIPYANTENVPLDLLNDYYMTVYIKPYCRIGPYIIGIAVGYFLLHHKELVLKRSVVACLWLLSVGLGLTVIYLMWPANQGILPSNAEAAAYSALARNVWAICIAWLVIACYYGYGGFVNSILSWSPFVPLSRLTYCAYLIHPVVMGVYYGSQESAVMFSRMYMIYTFLGNLCVTYGLSIILSLLFESPFVSLEKAILASKKS